MVQYTDEGETESGINLRRTLERSSSTRIYVKEMSVVLALGLMGQSSKEVSLCSGRTMSLIRFLV